MISLLPQSGHLDVLCLGAHADDIEIGCGGTLLALAGRPDTALAAVVLTAVPQRRVEAVAALPAYFPGAEVDVLDLPDGRLPAHWNECKETLEAVAAERKPHLVLAPRTDDAHQDHRLVGTLARTVWRDALILHYEIPKWDGDTATPSHYVPLPEQVARRKVELLNDCYPTQVGRDWWDDELFLGLMRIRGMECRSRYAEGFFASKVLLDLGAADEASP